MTGKLLYDVTGGCDDRCDPRWMCLANFLVTKRNSIAPIGSDPGPSQRIFFRVISSITPTSASSINSGESCCKSLPGRRCLCKLIACCEPLCRSISERSASRACNNQKTESEKYPSSRSVGCRGLLHLLLGFGSSIIAWGLGLRKVAFQASFKLLVE